MGDLQERRNLGRSDIFMVVEFTSEGGSDRTFFGITNNISTGGLSFESPDFGLNQREELEFKLKQPGSDLCVNVRGELVWKNRTDMFKCLNGVKLLDVNSSVESSILEIMSAAEANAAGSFIETVSSGTASGTQRSSGPDENFVDAVGPDVDQFKGNETWTDGKLVMHESISYAEKRRNILSNTSMIFAAVAALSVIYILSGYKDAGKSSVMRSVLPYLMGSEKGLTVPDINGFQTGYPPLMKLLESKQHDMFEDDGKLIGRTATEDPKQFSPKVFSGQGIRNVNKKESGKGSGGVRSGSLNPRQPRTERAGTAPEESRKIKAPEKKAEQQSVSAENKIAPDSTVVKLPVEPETDKPRGEGLIVTAGITEPVPVSAKTEEAPPVSKLPSALKDIKTPGNFPPIRFALVVTDKDVPDNTGAPGGILPEQRTLFNDSFDTNKNRWAVANTHALSVFLKNGHYQIENKNDKKAYLVFNNSEIEYGPEYVIDVSMKASQGTGEYSYGLVWGSREPLEYYVFRLTNKGGYFIERSFKGKRRILSRGGTEDAAFIKNGMNNLKVEARGKSTGFYINGNYVDGLSDLRLNGGSTGFIVEGKAKVAVDHINVSGTPVKGP